MYYFKKDLYTDISLTFRFKIIKICLKSNYHLKPRPRVKKKKGIPRKLKKKFFELLVGSKNDAAAKVRAYQEKKKSPCSGFQFVKGTPSCQSTDHPASSRESFSIESTDASSTNLHDSRRFCSFQNATEQRLGFGHRMRIRFRVERIRATVGVTPTRHLSRKLEAQMQRFSILSPM